MQKHLLGNLRLFSYTLGDAIDWKLLLDTSAVNVVNQFSYSLGDAID